MLELAVRLHIRPARRARGPDGRIVPWGIDRDTLGQSLLAVA